MKRYTARDFAQDCVKHPTLTPDPDAMQCDECRMTVDRVMILHGRHGAQIKICVGCLYNAYSDLRRAKYEEMMK